MAGKNGVSLNWGGLDIAVTHAARTLADTKPLMESVGEALVSGTIGRFEAEEDPEGKKWQASQRAQEEGGMTLTDTALLRRSIDYASTSDKVMVGSKNGSNLKYAAIHHFGGKAGRGKKVTIPARPFIGVSKEDLKEVEATIEDFVAGAFGGK